MSESAHHHKPFQCLQLSSVLSPREQSWASNVVTNYNKSTHTPATTVQGIPWHTETMMHGNNLSQYWYPWEIWRKAKLLQWGITDKRTFLGVQGEFSCITLGLENSLWSILFIEIDWDGVSNFLNKKLDLKDGLHKTINGLHTLFPASGAAWRSHGILLLWPYIRNKMFRFLSFERFW